MSSSSEDSDIFDSVKPDLSTVTTISTHSSSSMPVTPRSAAISATEERSAQASPANGIGKDSSRKAEQEAVLKMAAAQQEFINSKKNTPENLSRRSNSPSLKRTLGRKLKGVFQRRSKSIEPEENSWLALQGDRGITAPTNIVHNSHIGVTEDGQIETKNLPPDLKALFDSLDKYLLELGVEGLSKDEAQLVLKSMLQNPDVFREVEKNDLAAANQESNTPGTDVNAVSDATLLLRTNEELESKVQKQQEMIDDLQEDLRMVQEQLDAREENEFLREQKNKTAPVEQSEQSKYQAAYYLEKREREKLDLRILRREKEIATLRRELKRAKAAQEKAAQEVEQVAAQAAFKPPLPPEGDVPGSTLSDDDIDTPLPLPSVPTDDAISPRPSTDETVGDPPVIPSAPAITLSAPSHEATLPRRSNLSNQIASAQLRKTSGPRQRTETNDLLAAIRKGKELRAVQTVEKRGTDNPLLQEIKSGTKLRHVEPNARKTKNNIDDNSVLGLIAKALLDRREVIRQEEEELEPADGEWD